MNKSFVIKYSDLRMEFNVSKEDKISLLYCGLDSQRKRKIDKNLKDFLTFAECEYVGSRENKHRGLKLAETGYGKTNKYVCHTVNETSYGQELVIVTKNDVLEMESHFKFYKDVKAISCFNVVKNISTNDVKLTFVPSFFQVGVCDSNLKEMNLYYANSSWHVEAQWVKHSFYDLGIYNGNGFLSNSRFTLNNTGSWSTKEHLPMAVIENSKKHWATLVQVENNGSWHIELGDFVNSVYLSASGPEFNDNSWMKVLHENETFTSVQATLSFGKDFEETIQEITKARRIMRRPSRDTKEMPTIFNDYMHALWDTQTTDLIKPLVDIAASVGCDEFCIDAGWFATGSQWWNILGRWEEEKENFPNGGFKAVIDYIKSKGMGAGIWFEIEAVGMNSDILKEMKDGWLFKVNGQDSLNNERYQLNFDNPEVYQYAMSVIDRTMNLYNLDYIKVDYNVEAGVGNEWNSDSLGDGLLKHNRAFIRWLNEVMDKYPNLTIENCGSGGCRMDYEILKYCPIQSTSDQTNYRKYPYLASNVLTACPPEQAAVWSYPLNDYEKIMPTDEVVVMNMCNAMLGRIHLASFINKLPESQLDLIREGLNYYRTIADFKKRSVPVYPKGISHFFDKEVVGGIKDNNMMVLGVWNTSGKAKSVKVKLEKYEPKSVKVGYPTSIETKFVFDEVKKELEVFFSEDYGGRIFEVELKGE